MDQAVETRQRKAADRLTRKLLSLGPLPAAEMDAVGRLPVQVRSFSANATFVQEGDDPAQSCLVLEGFVFRYKLVRSGARQISAIHIPGDMPDLQSLHLRRMDHSLGALTAAEVAFIPHASIIEMVRAFPAVGDALWKLSLSDAAMFREWLTGVGRRPARARLAHLLCELYVRLEVVGLCRDGGFDLPLTQSVLGDSLGLSTVHINRVLQELRREKLISSEGRFLRILDWRGLCLTGEFDPAYLHLEPASPP